MTLVMHKNITEQYQPLNLREEPEWMTQKRQSAWNAYQELSPLPVPQRNLRKIPDLNWAEWPLAEESQSESAQIERIRSWGELSGLYSEVNGYHHDSELSSELSEKGIVFTSMAEAIQHHPELVQKHFASAYPLDYRKEVALNSAYWQGGFFLYIPKNQELKDFLYVLQSLNQNNAQVFSRSLIVLERNAKATLVQDLWSENNLEATRLSDAVEVILKDGASLDLVQMQELNRKAHVESYSHTQLGRDSQYRILNISTGAAYHYSRVGTTMPNPGAKAELLGLNLADGEQHFRQDTLQEHTAPHTESDMTYHNVLKDDAYSFFNGMIYVSAEGQQTVSNQVSKSLLLSENARADAIPNLEILADDVKSGHGAATAPLDPEQKFYLMSRGFSEEQAEALIIEGFIESILLRLNNEELRASLESHLSLRFLDEEH